MRPLAPANSTDPNVSEERVALLETIKLEVEAVPEIEREVVVAAVPVAFIKVKFWRVVLELARSV